jgi:hypothetical protein
LAEWAVGPSALGLIWKEGKADEPLVRARLVGWVALRRFCPTLRVEAPTAVLGSWVVTSGANLVDERIGRQPTFARRAERRAERLQWGSPVGLGGVIVDLTT